ncbi:MAG: hypothetical protein AAGE65_15050 [Planctomycetota bacterium]
MRMRIAVVTLAISAATAAAAGYVRGQARAEATQAAAELDEASRLIEEIWRLTDAGDTVPVTQDGGSSALDPATLARLLEGAAQSSGLDAQQIERVWPQPPERLDDSDYVRHATQLVVRGVTLVEALRFLSTLRSGVALGDERDTPAAVVSRSRLNVDAVRLVTPRSAATESSSGVVERWTLEATVSHIAFRPSAESESRR